MNRLLLTIVFCLVSASAWARGERPAGLAAGVAGFDTNIVFQTLDNGYLRTTPTNYGYFGTVRERLRDSTGEVVPVLESPVRSGIEYLYEAGLWIGGVVGSDTIVSTGSLGFGITHNFYADSYEPGVFSEAVGDREWTVNYGDTTTEPETVREDLYDGPHHPLPVRVRQRTYTFDALIYNSAVFMELTVVNVGTQPIENAWIGWLIDPDIGHLDADNFWMDDITGHETRTIQSAGELFDVSVAWAMDNDGDPDSTGQFGARSPKRAIGSMYLGGSPNLTGESYNWWVPSLVKVWDWGPQKFPGDTNIFGGHGFEVTDAFRYRLLSNQEIDYSQPYAAVDRTSEGWMPPTADSIARNFADGYEIRFLHSVGSTTIAPGDSLVVHWAWCLSPYAHTQPAHFANTFDADDPEWYLSGLGINYLAQLMGEIWNAWDKTFSFLPIGPPRNFRVESWTDTSATIVWSPKDTERLSHYVLYRNEQFGNGRWNGIERVVGRDTSFVDYGLDRSKTYYYWISAVGDPTAPSPKSPEDTLLPDRPVPPFKPEADAMAHAIRLSWPANYWGNVIGYRVYRRDGGAGSWDLVRGTDSARTFVDEEIDGATIYEYRVTAISALANESDPSPPVVCVAFAFDGPPQILDYTRSGPGSLTDKDSIEAAWKNILPGAVYRDASLKSTPYALTEYDAHPVTIIVSDGRAALPTTDVPFLNVYSAAEGATIVSGRDIFNFVLALDSSVIVPKSSIGYLAGIRKAYYPRTLLANPTRMNAEFIGAIPVDHSLPRLDVDSTRTGWGLNPALPHPGDAIPFVGYFEIDTALAEVIYTYETSDPQSPLQGKPVAVMSKEPGRTLAVFAFPLSYIEEADAKACVAAVLRRMGYGSALAAGDADTDGSVTAADVVFLVNFLFRDGYLTDERAADVNGDCRVDLLDVVYLMDHVYRGVGLVGGGCAAPTRM